MSDIFKPVISPIGYGVGSGLELFTASDIYRHDVDNRPLENLSANDTALAESIDKLVDEISDAWTGKNWPTGGDLVHNTLDDRMDNMDLFLQNFFEIRNVQFSSFMQNAAFLKERYTSGFLNGPFPSKFIRSNYSTENNGFMPSPFGGFYSPEKAGTVRNEEMPDEEMNNTIAMETRIDQDGTLGYYATRKPIYALVNGFTVPMISEYGGVSRKVNGNAGPIILNFSDAPVTGSRTDFTFLEVWLKVINPSTGYFYPYGGLDYAKNKKESMGALNAGQLVYTATVVGKKIIPNGEGAMFPRVYRLPSASSAIPGWDNTVAELLLEDIGDGTFTDTHSDGISGTIDYDTGEVTVTFTSDPGAGDELILVYRYRAVDDPSDERLRGTISFLPDGSYIQIQHQWRVVDDINYTAYPDFFSDSTIEARGPNDTDIGGYNFSNGINTFHDGSLWYSGSGNTASKSALDTYDGYIYALPVGAWARFNTTSWGIDNQNGGTGRLDDFHYKYPEDKYFLDLRPCVLNERYTVDNAAENTLDRIIRGAHKTLLANASVFHYYGLEIEDLTDTLASEVAELWIVPKSLGSSDLDPDYLYANRVFDLSLDVGYSDPPTETAYTSFHDGLRRVRSPQDEVQEVLVTIDLSLVNSASPSIIASFNSGSELITFNTDSSDISGWHEDPNSPGNGDTKGVVINPTYPRLWWRGTRQPVIFQSPWAGLGTLNAYATVDSTASSYQASGIIDGYVDLLYPTSTGIDRPLNEIDGLMFTSAGPGASANVTTIGNKDGSPAAGQEDAKWHDQQNIGSVFTLPTNISISPFTTGGERYLLICDEGNNRVVSVNATDLSYVGQYPIHDNYPFDPNSGYDPLLHLKSPVAAVWEDTAENYAYVVDRAAHMLVKLSKDLSTYQKAFGDGFAADNPAHETRLNSPGGVAIDSLGNVYVADTGMYRVVKLDNTLAYASHIGTGTSGSSLDQFIYPTGLTIGVVGGVEYLYVADAGRIVAINLTIGSDNFTVSSILGARTHENIDELYQVLGGGWNDLCEDTSNNKYVSWGGFRKVLKFNSDWVIQAEFGVEGERDTTTGDLNERHLSWPMGISHNEGAGVVYVGDGYHITTELDILDPDPGLAGYHRIIVLDDTTFEYLDELDLHTLWGITDDPVQLDAPSGVIFVPDEGGTGNSYLYVASGARITKLELPSGHHNNPSEWIETWTVDKFTNTTTFWKLAISADGTRVFTGDVANRIVYELNHVNGTEFDTLALPNSGDEEGGRPWSISFSMDEDILYIGGYDTTGTDKTKVLRVDISTPGSMSLASTPIYDTLNREGVIPHMFIEGRQGFSYVLGHSETYVYTSSPSSMSGDISGAFVRRLADIPLNTELHLALDWASVQGIYFYGGLIYATDPKMNTITVIDAASMAVKGQVGSPSALGKGLASFSGPMGMCIDPSATEDMVFLADGYNNRVVKTTRHLPVVERGTGRMTYLTPPAPVFEAVYQVRYNPYQGFWKNVNEPVIYGRNFVSDTKQVHVTTLGRGTLSYVSQEGGIGHYANMTAHLPSPLGTPKLARYITSDYVFSPTPLPITSEIGGTPYATLPVINRYPASAQEFYPLYGGGSRYDFNRILFVQGPGNNWPDNSNSWWGTMRGYDSTGSFPGFDVLETFPLKTLSIPRVIFSTATIELQGQLYLAVYTTYSAHAKNTLGNGPIVVDLFKMFGNPGAKPRY